MLSRYSNTNDTPLWLQDILHTEELDFLDFVFEYIDYGKVYRNQIQIWIIGLSGCKFRLKRGWKYFVPYLQNWG